MPAVHIRRLHARYRLPQSEAGQRRRLDGILASALGDAIDTALDRVPLSPHEELCIRHLAVPVRMRLGASDLTLAREWGEAVAAAIRGARESRDGRGSPSVAPWPGLPEPAPIEVVRFSSREAALLDLAVQVTRGQYRRQWAWRQLDLWRTEGPVTDTEAVRELVRTFVREPGRLLPILRALSDLDRLEALARRLEAAHWISLAAAALDFHQVSLDWRDLTLDSAQLDSPAPAAPAASSAADLPPDRLSSGEADRGDGTGSAATEEAIQRNRIRDRDRDLARAAAARILRASRIGAACPAGLVPPAGERGLAVLLALEADPGWTARPRAAWLDLLEALPILRRQGSDPSPSLDSRSPSPKTPARTSRPPEARQPTPEPRPSRTPKPRPDESDPAAAAESKEHDRDVADADEPPPGSRQTGSTPFGGLLFLLNVLPAVGFPALLTAEFSGRSVRWVQYRLGLRLLAGPDPRPESVPSAAESPEPAPSPAAPPSASEEPTLRTESPVRDDDPALLAFAGLPPGSPVPAEEPETEAERVRLDALRHALAGELERRLPAPEPGRGDLLSWVCRRNAGILADPGWIEVRFALQDVSTDLRRVGLDLDPGFVPWLGVVVKFTYE